MLLKRLKQCGNFAEPTATTTAAIQWEHLQEELPMKAKTSFDYRDEDAYYVRQVVLKEDTNPHDKEITNGMSETEKAAHDRALQQHTYQLNARLGRYLHKIRSYNGMFLNIAKTLHMISDREGGWIDNIHPTRMNQAFAQLAKYQLAKTLDLKADGVQKVRDAVDGILRVVFGNQRRGQPGSNGNGSWAAGSKFKALTLPWGTFMKDAEREDRERQDRNALVDRIVKVVEKMMRSAVKGHAEGTASETARANVAIQNAVRRAVQQELLRKLRKPTITDTSIQDELLGRVKQSAPPTPSCSHTDQEEDAEGPDPMLLLSHKAFAVPQLKSLEERINCALFHNGTNIVASEAGSERFAWNLPLRKAVFEDLLAESGSGDGETQIGMSGDAVSENNHEVTNRLRKWLRVGVIKAVRSVFYQTARTSTVSTSGPLIRSLLSFMDFDELRRPMTTVTQLQESAIISKLVDERQVEPRDPETGAHTPALFGRPVSAYFSLWVPSFHVFPYRELISDSIRRQQALDCPITEIMLQYSEFTDVFLEIGGFFGDCATVAAHAGWAKIGVVELDGSRTAIQTMNKTVAQVFGSPVRSLSVDSRALPQIGSTEWKMLRIEGDDAEGQPAPDSDSADATVPLRSDSIYSIPARRPGSGKGLDGLAGGNVEDGLLVVHDEWQWDTGRVLGNSGDALGADEREIVIGGSNDVDADANLPDQLEARLRELGKRLEKEFFGSESDVTDELEADQTGEESNVTTNTRSSNQSGAPDEESDVSAAPPSDDKTEKLIIQFGTFYVGERTGHFRRVTVLDAAVGEAERAAGDAKVEAALQAGKVSRETEDAQVEAETVADSDDDDAGVVVVDDKKGVLKRVRKAGPKNAHGPNYRVEQTFTDGGNAFAGNITIWEECETSSKIRAEQMQEELLGRQYDSSDVDASGSASATHANPMRDDMYLRFDASYYKESDPAWSRARGNSVGNSACFPLITVDDYVEKYLEAEITKLLVVRKSEGMRKQKHLHRKESEITEDVSSDSPLGLKGPVNPGVRFGIRIKVSGNEHKVLFGALDTLRRAHWLYLNVTPDCGCDEQVRNFLESIRRFPANKQSNSGGEESDDSNQNVNEDANNSLVFRLVVERRNASEDLLMLYQRRGTPQVEISKGHMK